MVATNVNQKFGYHKDTPFIIEDSSKGELAMEFNRNTKAILSAQKPGVSHLAGNTSINSSLNTTKALNYPTTPLREAREREPIPTTNIFS
jgi:hypothetical protein